MFRSLRVLLSVPVLLLLFVLLHAGTSAATTVSYNPAPTTSVGYNPCTRFAGYGCKTSAYFDATSLDTQNDGNPAGLFTSAFNAWNPGGWTDSVSDSLGGTFNVTIATACQFASGSQTCNSGVVSGGLTINILLKDVTLPALGAGDLLVWTQGLELNYALPGTPGIPAGTPAGTIVTPYWYIDTSTLSGLTCNGTTKSPVSPYSGSIFCPPAYPYQYTSNRLNDQPKDYYMTPGTKQAFFDANAYLAVENPTAKTLTLLDGVSYGWQNDVTPEPGSFTLFATALAVLALVAIYHRKTACGITR